MTHRCLLRSAFAAHDGYEVAREGDAFFVAFASARQAVAAAEGAHRALAAHDWPEGRRVWLRMGLHTGEPRLLDGNYVGLDVHHAARVMAAGHGGQVLLSQSTRDLVELLRIRREIGDPDEITMGMGAVATAHLLNLDHEAARDMFEQVIPLSRGGHGPPNALAEHLLGRKAGDAEAVMTGTEGVAAVAARTSEFSRAASLTGVAAALRDDTGIALQSHARRVSEETMGAIRANLEEQTILDEFAAGREIAREDPGAWVLSSA